MREHMKVGGSVGLSGRFRPHPLLEAMATEWHATGEEEMNQSVMIFG